MYIVLGIFWYLFSSKASSDSLVTFSVHLVDTILLVMNIPPQTINMYLKKQTAPCIAIPYVDKWFHGKTMTIIIDSTD